MLYERTTKKNTEIDYAAIKAQKNAMLQRFLLAKKKPNSPVRLSLSLSDSFIENRLLPELFYARNVRTDCCIPAFCNTGNTTQNHTNNTIENLNKGNFYVTKILPRCTRY